MALLLFNYALFGDSTLLIIGWVIAAFEAITAILKFIKMLLPQNSKSAEKILKIIDKIDKAIEKLKTKRAELVYNYQRSQNCVEKIEDNDEQEKPNLEQNVPLTPLQKKLKGLEK